MRWRNEWYWLIVVALLLIVGAVGLPASQEDTPGTFSFAAGGKRAYFSVVEQLNPPVSRTLRSFQDSANTANTLCILGPARYPGAAEWDWLVQRVKSGHSLVFATRHSDPAVELSGFGLRVAPDDQSDRPDPPKSEAPNRSASDTDTEATDTANNSDDHRSSKQSSRGRRRTIETSPPIQTELAEGKFSWPTHGYVVTNDEECEILATAQGHPVIVRKRVGAGTVVVCSSDYIFSNKSLATFDNGLLAYRILEAAEPDGVVFDESLNGAGAPKVLGLLFEPTVRPFTLQVMALMALFGWWGSRRFGPEQAAPSAEHRSMTEHAVALGNLHRKSETGGRALAWYMQYLRDELRLHYAAGSHVAEASALARRTGADEQTTVALLGHAKQLTQQDRVPGGRAARVIRELAQIKNNLDHGKGV